MIGTLIAAVRFNDIVEPSLATPLLSAWLQSLRSQQPRPARLMRLAVSAYDQGLTDVDARCSALAFAPPGSAFGARLASLGLTISHTAPSVLTGTVNLSDQGRERPSSRATLCSRGGLSPCAHRRSAEGSVGPSCC